MFASSPVPFEIKILLPATMGWHILLLGHPRPPQHGAMAGIFTAYHVEHLSKVTSNTCSGLEKDLMGVENLNVSVRDINVASKHTTVCLYYSLGKINPLIMVQLRYFGEYS